MLRVRLLNREAFRNSDIPVDVNYKTSFSSLLGGPGQLEVPPFRDRESLKFITEVDEGMLVDGDWYSYISPYGRSCMCHLCSGSQYALICIANSKHGIYTPYCRCDSDIFHRLGALETDILIAYDIWEKNFGVPGIPHSFPACIIENYRHKGQEMEVIYDPSLHCSSTFLPDASGRIRVSHWDFQEYKYIWQEDLPNLLRNLQRRLMSHDLLIWPIPPVEVSMRQICQACSCQFWEDEPNQIPRKILLCMHECPYEGQDKYPRIFYIRHFRDGTYSYEEHCPVKYPNFSEIIQDVTDLYNPECAEAFAAVFDVGCFFSPEDFEKNLLWEFHDNGSELTCFSGTLGQRKLPEFWQRALERKRLL